MKFVKLKKNRDPGPKKKIEPRSRNGAKKKTKTTTPRVPWI